MSPVYGDKVSAEEVADNNKDAIKGKVILTTGVTPGGIGATFMEVLARYSPKLLILAGRDTRKCHEAAKAITAIDSGVATRVLELDLSSQEQVRKAAAEVNGYVESIDVLCNNAGVMATPWGLTEDGMSLKRNAFPIIISRCVGAPFRHPIHNTICPYNLERISY